MNTPRNPPGDPSRQDLDHVAAELHDALHHDPSPPVTVDPGLVEVLSRRSSARRRAKVTAWSLVVVCLVIGSGVALAASHQRSTATNLAAGQSEGTVPADATDGDISSSLPSITSVVPDVPSTPVTSIVSGTGSVITTIPADTSTTAYPTTTRGSGPTDCGSATPSGWPTTVIYSPVAAQCLLDGFASGAADTFTEVIPDTDYPAHQITKEFLVVGVRLVQVSIDTSRSLHPTKTVIERCRQLSFHEGNSDIYAYSQCTAAG